MVNEPDNASLAIVDLVLAPLALADIAKLRTRVEKRDATRRQLHIGASEDLGNTIIDQLQSRIKAYTFEGGQLSRLDDLGEVQ
ncbi:hypothetical protein LQW54_002981 [Pestalotiopsis sp. IQ-011]